MEETMAVAEAGLALQAMPSESLTEAVQERLRNSPYQVIRGVSCEHRQGVVFLHGRLPSYYLKQVAQETVANLSGVVRVINAIEVV
jgi:osmotically-inducible protein OsmY